MSTAVVEHVTDAQFDAMVLESEQPIVVDVWAPWCGPCRAMAPNFEAAAKRYAGKARFLKLNSDENRETVSRYKIMGIPTVLYFSHGLLVDRKSGLQSAEAIEKRVEPLLGMDAETAEANEVRGWFRWPFRRKK
mgnify:CR=1 FL=1